MSKKLAALFVIALWPCAAQGQWYIGAEVAQAESDQAIPFDFPPDTETDDSADSAWKLFAGYRFAPHFAGELGYADLGEDYTTFNVLGSGEKTTMIVSALYASLVGTVSVSPKVDLLGRVGLAYWDVELEYEEGAFFDSGSDNDVDLLVGLGFVWNLSRALDLRFEWEQFQNVGDEVKADLPGPGNQRIELNGQDINVWGVSLTYQFTFGSP